MKTSSAGYDLIKRFEGFSASRYLCPADKVTIGYGHVVTPKDDFPETITEEHAQELLAKDAKTAEDAINRLVHVSLTQNQFDALVSFIFNLGAFAFQNSTLLKLINAKNFTEAAKQFERWIHAAGKELPGLVKRRQAESQLFLTKE